MFHRYYPVIMVLLLQLIRFRSNYSNTIGMMTLSKYKSIIPGKRCILMISLLLLCAVSESRSYVSKAVCYEQYQRYLQPAFVSGRDTGGFPEFRSIVNAGTFDQRYNMFDSLIAVLVDSLGKTVKGEYLLLEYLYPIHSTFWQSFYLHDDAFFKYAITQCEKKTIPAEALRFNISFSARGFTIDNIERQWASLKANQNADVCLRANCGFVDSVATLILADDSLAKSYRRSFTGMDRYADQVTMNAHTIILHIDSTFKGKMLQSIYAIDSSFITVAGDSGLIALSTDAGRHWRRSTLFTTNRITSIVFATKSKGCCIEEEMVLWYTNDTGATWRQANCPQGYYKGLVAFDSTRLMLFNPYNYAVQSIDGGATWTNTSVSSNPLTSVINRNCAFGVANLLVRKTTDGGTTWNDVCFLDSALRSYPPICMTFLNENIGMIGHLLGEMSITTDAGIHWRRRSPPTVENIIGIFRCTDHSALALTDGFTAFSTEDMGATWTKENVYYPSGLKTGAQMTSGRSVWVGGDGLLFFCEAQTFLTGASGQINRKPMVTIPALPHMERSYTLDGKLSPPRTGTPGLRLIRGIATTRKTVLVK
jgi:photosystem II stability/assembly factor-like uncharacterized protein